MTTAWMLDNFGQHAQLPQLLTQAGYKTMWFVRGVPKQEHPSEFFWEGIDGTKIPAYYLPHSYVLMYPTPRDEATFKAFARQRFKALDPNSIGPDRVGVSSADVSEPEEQQVGMVEAFNRDPSSPFVLKMAVPADYEAVASRRSNWPSFKGDLNPIFQGIYSSRIELKTRMREAERDLLNAEKLGVLSSWLGTPDGTADTWRAWEPVLFNETHDLASGVMTDHVYEDVVRGYDFSTRLARELIDDRWDVLARGIDTRGEGVPVVVFNPLGWTRNDVARVDLGFDQGGVQAVTLTDDQGHALPSQVVESTRYEDGGLKTARLAFVARDVPPLGYRTYHAKPTATAAVPAFSGDVLENEFYRISLDPASGAITGMKVKADGWDVFAGHANVVARQQDKGDLWEPYHGLDGASRVAMTTRENVPDAAIAVLSDKAKGRAVPGVSGPVVKEYRVSGPLDSGTFATSVTLYAGLRRVDIETKLVNKEKYVRYRALFPTSIKVGRTEREIPFGAIGQPNAIEFPAQNWVDHGDGKHGLALLNVGLPGNTVTDGTMMVSLLRAHSVGSYGFGGGYEPGMSSETGFQIGQERTLRYALIPHAGDWRDAGVYRDGLEFNSPLLCRKVAPHAGPLPPRWGLLDVSSPNVVVSSLKTGAGGVAMLRVYEATGRATPGVAITFRTKLASANGVNLMDDPGAALPVENDTLRFELKPFEIKTVAVRFMTP